MTTASCPPASLTLHRPPPRRWIDALLDARAAWRARAHARAEQQALDQLSDATRRDLGLGERQRGSASSLLWDHERGLW